MLGILRNACIPQSSTHTQYLLAVNMRHQFQQRAIFWQRSQINARLKLLVKILALCCFNPIDERFVRLLWSGTPTEAAWFALVDLFSFSAITGGQSLA